MVKTDTHSIQCFVVPRSCQMMSIYHTHHAYPYTDTKINTKVFHLVRFLLDISQIRILIRTHGKWPDNSLMMKVLLNQ